MKITNIGSDVKVDAHRQGEPHSGTEFPGDREGRSEIGATTKGRYAKGINHEHSGHHVVPLGNRGSKRWDSPKSRWAKRTSAGNRQNRRHNQTESDGFSVRYKQRGCRFC